MSAGFTPGPWSLSEPPYDSVPWLHVYGPAERDGSHKHIMHQDRSAEEKIANAKLIAKAPAMYTLLADIEESLTADNTYALLRTAIRDLLAKVSA